MDQPSTVGALRETGYASRSVKDEMRDNLIAKLKRKETLFPGIIGYDETVIPQIANAVLSRHDMLLLGLRGQAKTRIIRSLSRLLDEYVPVIADVELPDDPLRPQFSQTKAVLVEQGDAARLRWLHREERFHEKLATPDVTVADLIGEIDLIKHAEGRYLSDERVVHYGLIPRTNRGIFAINELPDLAPRIQVALFNCLEERDVQIRGFPLRLRLDICVVFSGNPEDYTNRGRIVTPLKDRIGSVIRTHYPSTNADALAITRANAWLERGNGEVRVDLPEYMLEVVEQLVALARKSPHISQQSGVSVRASIAGVESLVSNAERRAYILNESHVVPRISDLANVGAACRGKIELMLAEDDSAEDKLIRSMVGEAVKNVFENYASVTELDAVVECFNEGKTTVEIGDDVPSAALAATVAKITPLKEATVNFCKATDRPVDNVADVAAAAEFILEALYVNNRLSKYAYQGRRFYKR